jgi:hypothetical protein
MNAVVNFLSLAKGGIQAMGAPQTHAGRAPKRAPKRTIERMTLNLRMRGWVSCAPANPATN